MSRKPLGSSIETTLSKGSPVDFCGLHKKFKQSLRMSLKEKNIKFLKIDYDNFKYNNDADKKPPLDQSFRETLLIDHIRDIKKVGELISLSVDAAREDIVSVTIPVVLLGDAFDSVTLEKCEEIFTFVEDKVAVWKEELFFTACKNNLLRMCNDLLRRLSRSQNTVFCGRILLFLAKFFPFSERSGLNIISEFNLDNITEYGADGKDVTEVLVDSMEDVPVQIDYNLYCKFWALQDYFRNPNQCYNKVQWKTFSLHATSVLSAFSSFKLEEPRNIIPNNEETSSDSEDTEMEHAIIKSEHFFAKFLTNPKLLALQLSDSNFRRSVLVQILILFQYLSSTVKFKAESFSLTPNQCEFIKETDEKVYKLLEETPPCGKKFARTVKHMLQREEIWNNWKNEGCKEFKRPDSVDESTVSVPAKPPARKKRRLGDLVRDASRQNKFYLGNPELTRLWNLSPDNLQACKGEDRNFLPPLETYLENSHAKIDPSFEWRALRLLARQSPHFFTLFNTPSYKVSDYLETVRKKIQKDKIESRVEVLESNSEPQESESVNFNTEPSEQIGSETEPIGLQDDKNTHKTKPVTKNQIAEIAPRIGSDWQKLGKKLGFSVDELLFFETENLTVADQCAAMLNIWFDDDVDASLDNLAYILEGLDMNHAADVVKNIVDPPGRMEDISD